MPAAKKTKTEETIEPSNLSDMTVETTTDKNGASVTIVTGSTYLDNGTVITIKADGKDYHGGRTENGLFRAFIPPPTGAVEAWANGERIA